jgi:hypothetical protein
LLQLLPTERKKIVFFHGRLNQESGVAGVQESGAFEAR